MKILNRFTEKMIFEVPGDSLTRANLSGADLTGADLTRANLSGADLTDADLTRADLTRANLSGADLTDADLTRANLTDAVLTGADLTRADLTDADLTGADLTDADLTRADLTDADLTRANLTFSLFPSIRLLSSMPLDDLSDMLTLELMRRDAYAHPHPERFDAWAQGGPCPYQQEERFWLFNVKKEIWSPGPPQMADRDLITAICQEKRWKLPVEKEVSI